MNAQRKANLEQKRKRYQIDRDSCLAADRAFRKRGHWLSDQLYPTYEDAQAIWQQAQQLLTDKQPIPDNIRRIAVMFASNIIPHGIKR